MPNNDKVISVRVSMQTLKELEGIRWWERHETLTQTLKMLLQLGIYTWKIRKGLNPNIILEIETK